MFKDKLRARDIKAIVLFSVAWPFAAAKRRKNIDLWLISERHGEARDNGYWMFRYMKEKVPEQKVCYVIDKNATDRRKIEQYGDVISFGSFQHYVMYLLASKHVSAHVDSDSPNSRVSNFLETHGLLKNKRVFLQHGITKDRISFGYYSVSRADLFVCAAKPEYEFCKSEFGYPDGAVQLLGFARFDGLGIAKQKRRILLMPTWRSWLADVSEEEFQNSDYFKMYQNLIADPVLQEQLEDRDCKLVFYPHSDMQKYISLFKTESANVMIANAGSYDIQALLNESALLITDYSSVAFDMAYMGRPVIYYQFDYAEYRSGQHPEGYFSYERDGFGCICRTQDELIREVVNCMQDDFETMQLYHERQKKFFAGRDKKNCKRIYDAIERI
jgi:CDP-glycerol glycerophosphotransferase (TagB/SpsB family)